MHAPTYVIVRDGPEGEQLAFHLGATRSGKVQVAKWRANSGRWTHRVAVPASDVLREATVRDRAQYKATPYTV